MVLRNVVVVEGIDGCGKGAIVNQLAHCFKQAGHKLFDVRSYQKEKGDHPSHPEFSRHNCVLTCEPSFAGVGRQIRDKLIRKGSTHGPMTIAEAYSYDRKELHRRVIIPASRAGKFVLQERNVASSLVYQPIHAMSLGLKSPSRQEVLGLPGNAFCLDNAPELMIIADVDPEQAMKRIIGRDKNDDCEFEKLEFQKSLARTYKSDWLRQLFEGRGTKVFFISTADSLEDTQARTSDFFNKNLRHLF